MIGLLRAARPVGSITITGCHASPDGTATGTGRSAICSGGRGVVAPLWLRAKSAYGGGRGMFEHEVSQALPVQAREAEEVPRSHITGRNTTKGCGRRGDLTVSPSLTRRQSRTGRPTRPVSLAVNGSIQTWRLKRAWLSGWCTSSPTDKPKASCTRWPRFSGSVSRSRTTRRCVGARGCSARSCGFRKPPTDKPKASCTRSPRFSGSVSRSRTTRRCVSARGCSARSCGFRKPRALNPST